MYVFILMTGSRTVVTAGYPLGRVYVCRYSRARVINSGI